MTALGTRDRASARHGQAQTGWRRRYGAAVVGAFAALALAACSPSGYSRLGSAGTVGPAPVTGEVLGTGSVKVALLVPMSAAGNTGAIGNALKNAAQLALNDFSTADIQILVKDTSGTPGGASAAAQEAISQGAELIIGPLIASSVAAAAPVARPANVPIVAFSTDASVAGRSVYLLSFLPQNDIRRILSYAEAQGRRSHAALLPDNAYGTIVEGALKQTASRRGGRIVAIERYSTDLGQAVPAVERIAAAARSGADSLLIPDGSAALQTISPTLAAQGLDTQAVKLLGSGQWDSPTVRADPFMVGGWYPSPNPDGWNQFRSRFQSTYGSVPPRIATLSYDAVSLAAALSRGPAGQRYTDSVLTNPSGFSGVDGIFRFTRNGQNERGLAVIEVTAGGGTRIIDPAPTRFSGAGL